MEDDGVRAAIEGELALLDPEVRTSPTRTAALLDDAFVEFGSSGRRWDRTAIIAAMAGDLSLVGDPVGVQDLHGVRLAKDVVHLTYLTGRPGSASRRSSLWRRTDGRWLVLFHQGTPVPLGEIQPAQPPAEPGGAVR